tara:strand:- start:157 stop:1581 length:1425 start_codon:yes stop_codon:yes gene_type:complete
MSFFHKNNVGDIISRVSEDVSKVRMYLGPAILYSMNLIILLIFILSRMFIVSPKLTFWALLPLPVLSVSIYYISKHINIKSEYTQIKLAQLTNVSQQIISGVRTVKSSVNEVSTLKYFNSFSAKYMKSQLDLVRVNALFFPFMLFIVGSSILLTISAGSYYNVNIGIIAEFIIYVNMLTWPVTSIGWVTSIIQTASASQKRINEFLYENSETDCLSNKKLDEPIRCGEIKFKNVFYNYSNRDFIALKDINLDVKGGSSLGIIGPIGSGKSTIIKLICYFLSASKGSIYIDNILINDLKIPSIRSSISYVPQDDFLFSDTIKNNLLFGNIDATEDDIKNALKDVCMYKEVLKFKEGLNTYIGERGVTLSGGQKQRLSIARAILKKSKILLLDDCFSSVDVNTEKNILATIFRKHKKDFTVIIVSNRIHSIMHCDSIIVLEKGCIIEEGRHVDLLDLKGFYHKLNSIQMQNFNKKA